MPVRRLELGLLLHRLVLVALSSFWHFAVMANLTPVYGSAATSSIQNRASLSAVTLSGCIFLAVRWKWISGTSASATRLAGVVPCVAILCAICEHNLNERTISALLGPDYGPLLNLILCWLPVAFSTNLYVFLSVTDLTAILVLGAGTVVAWATTWMLNQNAAKIVIAFTRWGLLATGTSLYAVAYPSRQIAPLLLLGGIFFTLLNAHSPFGKSYLDSALLPHGFRVLERVDSVTGYISVVENVREGYMALRCDHSLLGGNWLVTPQGIAHGMTVPEPIYPVFTMLEAVRLMETGPSSQAQQSALVIGLGIGTCPSAFDQHGIQTTVIELDPQVTRMARKYFELPASVKVHDMDALQYVSDAEQKGIKYDFLIHDVFTGGDEPAMLFSEVFLRRLGSLLKPHGAIAINYAGDLERPEPWETMDRIQEVFGNCKIYRDNPRVESGTGTDFTNAVIFCQQGRGKWSFREPVQGDFLGSTLRQQFLVPQHVVSREKPARTRRNRRQSALDHWRIMRQVLPDVVWEVW